MEGMSILLIRNIDCTNFVLPNRAQKRKKWFLGQGDKIKAATPFMGKLFHPLHDVNNFIPFGLNISFVLRKNPNFFIIQTDVSETNTNFEVIHNVQSIIVTFSSFLPFCRLIL